MVPIADLVIDENNVKIHTPKQINDLAEQFKIIGFKDPLVIDKKNKVWAGKGRVLAAKQLEMTELPCIYAENLTRKQLQEFMIKDNAVNESPWDKQNTMMLMAKMPDFKMESFNFQPYMPKPEIVEDITPELQSQTDIKHGDIFQLGQHRIMCGNSLNAEHREKLFNGTKPHMNLTDPPYNVDFDYKDHDDKQPEQDYLKFSEDLHAILKDTAERTILTVGYTNIGIWTHIEKPFHIGIWTKANSTTPGKISYFSCWEPVLFYGNFKGYRNVRNNDIFDYVMQIPKELTDAQEVHNLKHEHHAPSKPVKFWCELINTYSQENERICDFFLGNGTSVIACEQTERICYGMEIDPLYVQLIIDRWENFTKKKAIKL